MKRHRYTSRLYLDRSHQHILNERADRAADALRRSASHAATAAAVNAGLRHSSRHQLMTALYWVIRDGHLTNGHIQTFRQVHALTPEWLDSVDPRRRRFALLRMYRRVRRLVNDVESVIDGHRNPPRVRDIVERLGDGSGLVPPLPAVKNIGELRVAIGLPPDPPHAGHPVNCLRCRTADPFPPPHDPPT